MFKSICAFWNARSGNFSLVTAILVPTLVFAVGGAIDFTNAQYLRSRVHVVADSAALAGVAEAAMNNSLNWPQQKEASLKASKEFFVGAITNQTDSHLQDGQIDYTADSSKGSLTVNVCYRYKYNSFFSILAYKDNFYVSGCASAVRAEPRYVDTYFVVDASGSMGIGATAADQALMIKRTGCAFACHTQSWLSQPKCNTGYVQTTYCAHLFGATLRFDVVKNAINTLVDNSASLAKVDGQFRFGLYKFSNTMTKQQSITLDTGKFKDAVEAMQPDAIGAGSNLKYSLKQIADTIPVGGDGRTPSSPQIFVIVMTDGVEGNVNEYEQIGSYGWGTYGNWSKDTNFVENNPGFWNGNERSQAVNPTICNVLKSKNITVGTLHTEYLVPAGSTDSRFVNIKSKLVPGIVSSLQACATSPDYAFIASSPADIQKATQQIFAAMMAQARLVM